MVNPLILGKDWKKKLLACKKTNDDNMIKADIFIMKEFGYTKEELDNLYIPTYFCINQVLKEAYDKSQTPKKSIRGFRKR